MKTLDEIAIEQGTDKATQFTRTYAKPHGYTLVYERFFEPLRREPIKFLEIGIGGGESARAWLEYFTQAQIVGVDIVKNTNPWNDTVSAAPPHERYHFCQGDQSDNTFWNCFLADFGSDWTVIMDDGSHIASHIITTFNHLWPHVKSGGLYAIEDLNQAPDTDPWLRDLVRIIHTGQTEIESMTFSKELCILRKRSKCVDHCSKKE